MFSQSFELSDSTFDLNQTSKHHRVMVCPSKSSRSSRASLRSTFSSREEEQATPRKPVVPAQSAAPLSPCFRLTRRKPVVRRPCLLSLCNDPKMSEMNDSTCCSEMSEDSSVTSILDSEEETVAKPKNAADPLEITQAHFRSRLPYTPGMCLSQFLEKDRKSVRQEYPTSRFAPVVTSSKTTRSSTPVRGPFDGTNLAELADFDVSLYEEIKKTLPKTAKEAQKKCGRPTFVQLRFSGGEAHVDYVRLPRAQKGKDGTSPAPKLTKSCPLVGLRKGVLNAAA